MDKSYSLPAPIRKQLASWLNDLLKRPAATHPIAATVQRESVSYKQTRKRSSRKSALSFDDVSSAPAAEAQQRL
jgi:hypothetical protein